MAATAFPLDRALVARLTERASRAECDLQEALVEITRLKQERAQLEHEVERLNAAAR